VDLNVSRESVNKLLQVLRTDPSYSFLPKTYKTLLGTPRKVHVIAVSPGFYHGFNILDGIVCSLKSINATFSSNSYLLKMLVGIDGTSVGKSRILLLYCYYTLKVYMYGTNLAKAVGLPILK
jgi:hypothetical protein